MKSKGTGTGSKSKRRTGLPAALPGTSKAAARLVGDGRADGRKTAGSGRSRQAFFLDASELERLRRAAYHDRVTQGDIVRDALRVQLDRMEKRNKGAYPAVPARKTT